MPFIGAALRKIIVIIRTRGRKPTPHRDGARKYCGGNQRDDPPCAPAAPHWVGLQSIFSICWIAGVSTFSRVTSRGAKRNT